MSTPEQRGKGGGGEGEVKGILLFDSSAHKHTHKHTYTHIHTHHTHTPHTTRTQVCEEQGDEGGRRVVECGLECALGDLWASRQA